jgi:predicted GNAT family acetyltransferase
MKITRYTNIKEFAARSLPVLLENEAENCLILGIIERFKDQDVPQPSYFWLVEDEGEVLGVAWMTPPYPFGFTRMPLKVIPELIRLAGTLPDRPTGVMSIKSLSDEFATKWLTATGAKIERSEEQRIFQADRMTKSGNTPGRHRIATLADRPVLLRWHRHFMDHYQLLGNADEILDQALVAKSRYVWEVEGEIVSMGGSLGSTPSGIRLSWAYTPKEHRGKGYASALVASVTKMLLAEGKKFCFIYTDLANPVSNSIYQAAGYQPVSDVTNHYFAYEQSS